MDRVILPRNISERYQIAPVCRYDGGMFIVRSVSELSPDIVSEVEFFLGGYLKNQIIAEDGFQKELETTHPNSGNVNVIGQRFKVSKKAESSGSDISVEVDDAPVVKLVDNIISKAIDIGASDIHLEPRENGSALRYRLDGVLNEQDPIPTEKRLAVVSRLKVMADMDIAEKRRPQDGRIGVEAGNRKIDLRVSVIPAEFGEKVAIRILDKTQLKLDIHRLGMSDEQIHQFKDTLRIPNGIILVTGPTGSGKTTTLYAALNYIKNPNINIMTIEDPIEYSLNGVIQSQVKPEIGYDFASALRTFLRQDPDVILVGEIRDLETAEIAIRASLTGHLVLSTLHTNDAPSAITRLIDIGLEPYLVASSLVLIMAQRLVRILCPYCKTEYQPKDPEAEELAQATKENTKIFRPAGCPKCFHTGYIGRTGIFELMPISGEIIEMVHDRSPVSSIRDKALADNMIPLKHSALNKVSEGITSFEEMYREIL